MLNDVGMCWGVGTDAKSDLLGSLGGPRDVEVAANLTHFV